MSECECPAEWQVLAGESVTPHHSYHHFLPSTSRPVAAANLGCHHQLVEITRANQGCTTGASCEGDSALVDWMDNIASDSRMLR